MDSAAGVPALVGVLGGRGAGVVGPVVAAVLARGAQVRARAVAPVLNVAPAGALVVAAEMRKRERSC